MSYKPKPKTINPDEVDPSVYLYDEVYDEMKEDEKRELNKDKSETSDKPQSSKYIQNLLESANQRKSDKELRKFKRYAKDREEAQADGELEDLDVYITPTYKRKLEEIKRIDEAKRRRLEQEKEKSLNFLKSTQPQQQEEKYVAPGTSSQSEMKDVNDDKTDEPTSIEIQDEEQRSKEHIDAEEKIATKRPKTIEERKEFLRKVLAKRTVGHIFDAAVERYKLRKAAKTMN